MPYITVSIIVQLLGTVIPKFAEWREQGAVGQRKLTQTTRYLTVALARHAVCGPGLRSSTASSGCSAQRRPDPELQLPLATSLHHPHLTAGTAFVMWLGELITQRGIGQGMSHPHLRQRRRRHP